MKNSNIEEIRKIFIETLEKYGAYNAANLDGGGSTVMYVKGEIVNKPQEKGGIPLSHTVTVSLKNS